MSSLETNADQPMVYEIRIKGHLDSRWSNWFEGLTITLTDNGDTLLTGQVIDQSALYGLLKKVRDSGMSLLAVNCIDPRRDEAADDQSSSSGL